MVGWAGHIYQRVFFVIWHKETAWIVERWTNLKREIRMILVITSILQFLNVI